MQDDTSKDQAGVIAPPPLIYAGSLIAGLVLQESLPVPFLPRFMRAWLGGVFMGAGLMFGLSAFRVMRNAHTPIDPREPVTSIVTSGPFMVTRNPIYVGLTLLYAGISVLANAFWPFLLLPITLRIMNRGVIQREEQYLERKFGEQYLSYKQRVRRWL